MTVSAALLSNLLSGPPVDLGDQSLLGVDQYRVLACWTLPTGTSTRSHISRGLSMRQMEVCSCGREFSSNPSSGSNAVPLPGRFLSWRSKRRLSTGRALDRVPGAPVPPKVRGAQGVAWHCGKVGRSVKQAPPIYLGVTEEGFRATLLACREGPAYVVVQIVRVSGSPIPRTRGVRRPSAPWSMENWSVRPCHR